MNTVQETINVSKKLFSRFKSINKAIQHAKNGSKIIVEPGIYSEKIIINKEIEIIADTSKGEIIIESDSTMIIMDTDEYAIIKGLTIRQPLTATEFAIDIPKGKLILEDCMIEAGISDCIYIANEADPLIKNCKIYNGKGKGIVFNNYAKGTIDSCELFGFNSAAMWVTSGSSPLIKNCKFYDGKGIGIAFDNNGQGTILNCEIFQFEEYPLIWINDNSNPFINGCNIYNGKGAGIKLENNSNAVIENCHISNFRKATILIDDHSKAEIKNCDIDDEIEHPPLEPKKSNRVVAIDLGVSNTRVAYIENNELKLMPFSNVYFIPSYLSFINNGWVIGEEARANAEVNKNAFPVLNQYIGINHTFTIDNTDYSADELLGIYLTCLKGLIDDYFNGNIEEYVITTSNLNNYIFFNSLKNAIINHTDLQVVRLIGQTKAQGLYYGKGKEDEETVLLINMGATSTEITIMNKGDGAFWVLTTNNFSIGGNQFDIIIVNYLLKKFYAVYNYDLTKDAVAMQRIKNAAQQAKHDLTHNSITRIFIPYIFFEGADYKNLDIELTRNEFEQLSGEIVNQLKTKIQNELKSAGSTLSDEYQIEKIIITGGSTRVPLIRQLFENELFPSKKPLVVLPDHSPVFGAAIQAGVITGDVKDIVLLDILDWSICIETSKGIYIELVDKNTTIPTLYNTVFTTTYDHQTHLDFHLVYDDGEKDSLKKTICFFQIQGLSPAPKGDARLDVEIDIDKNRLIGVTVKDSNRDVVLQHILLGEPLQNIQSSVQNEIAVCKQVKEKFINNHGEIYREIYRISDLAEIEKIQKGLMKVEQLLNQNETSDAVLNLRVISETFTRQIAIHNELTLENMDQHSRVNYLYEQSYLNSELYKLLNVFRKLGNKAAHEIVNNEYFDKNELLKLHDQLSSYVKDWVLKVIHS